MPWSDPVTLALLWLVVGGLPVSLAVGVAPARRGRALVIHAAAALTALVAGGYSLAVGLTGAEAMTWAPPAALVGIYALLVVIPSPPLGRLLAATAAGLREPRARRWTMIGLWAGAPFLALAVVHASLGPELVLENEDLAAMVDLGLDALKTEDVPDSPLRTDRGRPLPARRLPAEAAAHGEQVSASERNHIAAYGLTEQVIALAGDWQNANCHGFVFTGGAYWVRGEDVDDILGDNGYEPVAGPRAGDVAVYRDGYGAVAHTGIVRGAATEGVVLVESKWGKLGRFVHRHDRHPYPATTCTFYRSPRAGHVLVGVHTDSLVTQAPAPGL